MDPIADMLTIIRNAQAVKKETVKVSYSKIKFNLAKILEKHGFVEKVEIKGVKHKAVLILTLKYNEEGVPAINSLKRISTPGRRIYIGYKDLKKVKSGYGMSVISTPKGLLSNKEARDQKVGGEYVCDIW